LEEGSFLARCLWGGGSFMDKEILFIHCAGPQGEGEGSTGLVAYLRKSLEGWTIHSPAMPTPENPQFEEWKAVIKKEIARLPNGSVLIGHSIGGAALLKFFLEADVSGGFNALIAVGSPYWGLDDDWIKEDFKISQIPSSWKTDLPPIILFHSIEDPIVPFSHAERYAEILPGAAVEKITWKDHLFQEGLQRLAEVIREC